MTGGGHGGSSGRLGSISGYSASSGGGFSWASCGTATVPSASAQGSSVTNVTGGAESGGIDPAEMKKKKAREAAKEMRRGYAGANPGGWTTLDLRIAPAAKSVIVYGLEASEDGTRYGVRLRAKNAGGWGAAVELACKTVPMPPPPEVLTPRGARHRNRRRHISKWRDLQARRRRDGVCLLSNPSGRGVGFFTKVQGHFCIATHRALISLWRRHR